MQTLKALRRVTMPVWVLCGLFAFSFGAGTMATARVMQAREAKMAQARIFELMIYHTLPGKAPELESIFRASAKLQARYLDVVGYWVPNEDPAWKNTFVYLIAHPSREAATKNWHAFHSDPAFPPYRAAAAPLIEHAGEDYKVDEIYMRPSDFSAMR